MPLILGFVELLAGVLLLVSGLTSASIAQVAKGQARDVYDQNPTPTPGADAAAAAGDTSSAGAAATPTNATPSAAAWSPDKGGFIVNPVPGSVGSRLDQGFDVTGRRFLAPFAGTVVAATPSDPGWAGGGLVAIANALDPAQIVYFAEGLAPSVSVGQTVTAGESIATPATNPYNGILGNIEFGPANPANPSQPLAQVVSDARALVENFYAHVRSIGGPKATSTSLAGSA